MAASTEVVDTTAWKQALFFKLHQIELKAPRRARVAARKKLVACQQASQVAWLKS